MRSIIRRYNVLLILALFFMCSFNLYADDYRSEMEGFEKYKSEINEEFRQYLNIVNTEFSNFKKEVYREWGDYLMSDNKRWVEYSSDMKIRKVVDFEKNQITIQIKSSDKKKDENELKKTLNETLTEDYRTAFSRNKLAQNIEKSAEKIVENPVKGDLPEGKVIGDLISKNKDSKEIANRIFDDAKIDYSKTKKGEKIATLNVKLKVSDRDKALKFKEYVDKYSSKYSLPPELIYAIIHTESYFNPMATSPAPAYGLMQIMPTNAGKDAARVLYGSPTILLPSFLYNPDNNINVGTIYFNLLQESYIKEISNPLSRQYIAIVGYNVGLRNVLKLFSIDGNVKNASVKINQLSPENVYDTILKNLPQRGGADYLLIVRKRMEIYKGL